MFAQKVHREDVIYGEGNTFTLNGDGVLDSCPPLLEPLGVTEKAWREFVEALQRSFWTTFDLGVAPALAPFTERVTLGGVRDEFEAWWTKEVSRITESFGKTWRLHAELQPSSWSVLAAGEDGDGDPRWEVRFMYMVELVPSSSPMSPARRAPVQVRPSRLGNVATAPAGVPPAAAVSRVSQYLPWVERTQKNWVVERVHGPFA